MPFLTLTGQDATRCLRSLRFCPLEVCGHGAGHPGARVQLSRCAAAQRGAVQTRVPEGEKVQMMRSFRLKEKIDPNWVNLILKCIKNHFYSNPSNTQGGDTRMGPGIILQDLLHLHKLYIAEFSKRSYLYQFMSKSS